MSDVASKFATLMSTTPIGFDSGPEDFINDVARQSYTAPHLLAGHSTKELQATGPKIKDIVYLEQGQRRHSYIPGQPRESQNPQMGTTIQTHWAMSKVDMAWTEPELEFNMNGFGMSKAGKKAAFKSVKDLKERDAWTAHVEGFEDELWAQPNAGAMEHIDSADVAAEMLSIPAIVNEETNGLWAGFTGLDSFTTVMGVDPTSKTKWLPQQIQYANGDADFADSTNDQNLLDILDEMYHECKFTAPKGIRPEAYTQAASMDQQVVVGGATGHKRLVSAFRQNGENFVTMTGQDPVYGGITIGGRKFIRYSTLDTLALYKDGSNNAVNSENATNSGPRFYFLNGKHLWPKFYKGKFFEKKPVETIQGTGAGGFLQPIVSWGNLWCNSRQRLGIVYPGA